ncbi:hypothetical protein ACHAWF_018704 [Thalassiosira exigua]
MPSKPGTAAAARTGEASVDALGGDGEATHYVASSARGRLRGEEGGHVRDVAILVEQDAVEVERSGGLLCRGGHCLPSACLSLSLHPASSGRTVRRASKQAGPRPPLAIGVGESFLLSKPPLVQARPLYLCTRPEARSPRELSAPSILLPPQLLLRRAAASSLRVEIHFFLHLLASPPAADKFLVAERRRRRPARPIFPGSTVAACVAAACSSLLWERPKYECFGTCHHRNARDISESPSEQCHHAAHVRCALSAGPLPYERGWAWQHVLLNRRLNFMRMQAQKLDVRDGNANNDSGNGAENEMHGNDCILLFEHEPVYTLGRGASEEHLTFLDGEPDGGAEKRRRLSRKYRGEDASRLNVDRSMRPSREMSVEEEVDLLSNRSRGTVAPVRAPNGAPIYRIERGGEVTYHGPGQLVMYPLLDLRHSVYEQDLHWYLRQIEEVIIRTLAQFDITSNRDDINTGVWVGQNKIAAVGVSSSRWITTHGLAINVNPNLDHFDKDIITPCGIEERGVTSISEILGSKGPTVKDVSEVALRSFGDVFNIELAARQPMR